MQTISQAQILQKLGIEKLNAMQHQAMKAISSGVDIQLLSPTGTGKTLAFLLPLVLKLASENLEGNSPKLRMLVLAPSRELAQQIEQVAKAMGSGLKVNVVYGGRQIAKDKDELKQDPDILIGTPGRVADHFRRETVDFSGIEYLVLDEFDKSLEIGFEGEMKEIISSLGGLKQRLLTSATQLNDIPEFVGLGKHDHLNFLDNKPNAFLEIKTIVSPEKDKLPTLVNALCHLGNQSGIVFLNYKDSIKRVSEYLTEEGVPHGCFYGGMEQFDRELALIKFRNGSHKLLLATDLAARGIDVPELGFIIHYHFPIKLEEFTHRNGRTARMQAEGKAFILKWKGEDLPEYMQEVSAIGFEEEAISDAPLPSPSEWNTLRISAGRKDKISKGDIAGWLMKQGGLAKENVGMIELKPDMAFVALKANNINKLTKQLAEIKLKGRKVKVVVV
jgi:superfamily II DNA/RNA helicase